MSILETDSIKIIKATEKHIKDVIEVTNDAFMADAFFKSEKYILRLDLETATDLVLNSIILVAIQKTEEKEEEVVGSLHLIMSHEIQDNTLKVKGKFSHVSVPTKFGKRGIGKLLVKSIENYLELYIKDLLSTNENLKNYKLEKLITMSVINQRHDLFPWYEKQGYVIIGKEEDSTDIDMIASDEYRGKVYCIVMEKYLD